MSDEWVYDIFVTTPDGRILNCHGSEGDNDPDVAADEVRRYLREGATAIEVEIRRLSGANRQAAEALEGIL